MLRWVTLVTLAVLGSLLGALVGGRRRHARDVRGIWRAVGIRGTGAVYRSELASGLPEIGRRFFENALADGRALPGSVYLTMEGKIGLQPGAEKQSFIARQVISRTGLVWAATVGSRWLRIVGDDSYGNGRGAMAWYLWGLIPVVRAEGPDISRSAAGRVAIELGVVLPSALLPSEGARWEQLDGDVARVTMEIEGESFEPLLVFEESGRLSAIEMPRWDADAGDGTPGLVLWRAELDGQREFDGITIPTRMRVTKRWGTPEADLFFEATITSAVFR
jgi:hypothetical protein